jgi:uncharacterized protein (DUF736 family)
LAQFSRDSEHGWLDLRQIATVELTSEDPHFPIDSALNPEAGGGWRASQNGEQLIRLIFDEPISLCRIQLHFREAERERTQEFTLRWSSAAGVVGANFLGAPTLLLPSGLVTLSERRFSRAFLRIPQPPLFSKPPAVK